jgi:class 3 adenylate cyclase/tetratricopeptide (TPR) repeat protein
VCVAPGATDIVPPAVWIGTRGRHPIRVVVVRLWSADDPRRRPQNDPMTMPSEDRRLVTILFADLVGFTGRVEAADPESMREMQRAYFEAVSHQVTRYGGEVEKYIGDAVMAVFGVPQAHDDDAERALHAAIGIRDAVHGLGLDLEIRIGVDTGEVVGGLGTGPSAGEYTVTGDAVNVAARLQQAASPGEILVGAVTGRLAGEGFELEDLASPLELKGKSASVEAYRVVRTRAQRLRLRGGQLPLVGRARELAAVDAAIDEVAAGNGLLLAIVGEAGIGKSRLALELRRHAEERGFATVWATARSYSDAFPFHLLSQVVEELLARRPGIDVRQALVARGVAADAERLDRWAALLAEILGDTADDATVAGLTPTARQHALVQAMTGLVNARSSDDPLLLVLDDLQWGDAASVAILDELVDAVPNLPVLAVALYRAGWTHGWSEKSFYQQVNLGVLRPSDTKALARELLSDLAPGEPSQAVLDRSGGNPFFLEELLKTEATDLDAAATRRLPETIHEVVLARIDGLPADARQVLQLASVVGMEFTEPILAALEPDAPVEAAIRALQRQDLVVVRTRDPEPLYAFRHQLIHEVAYRSLLFTRRRQLHARIAGWLEARGGDELLPAIASHYRDSDDVDKARTFLPKAADRAAGLNAAHEALRFYLEAAELFHGDPARRAPLLEAASRQAYLVAEVEQAIQLMRQAIDLYQAAGNEPRSLFCRIWVGRYNWLAGRGDESEAEIARAIEGLERLGPSPDLALAYSFRSQVRMLMPDFVAAEAWARKAIDVAEETGATGALVHAYNNLGCSLAGLGDPSGPGYIRRSLELALEHNLPDDAARAYVNLSGQGEQIAYFGYGEMEALFEEAIDFSERMIPGGSWSLWLNNAWAEFLFRTGRWDEAERVFTNLTVAVRANAYLLVSATAFRGLIASLRGDHELGAELIRAQVEPVGRIGDLQALGPVLMSLAHTEASLGNGPQVVTALRRLVEARGDRPESDISAWITFEAADVIGWLATTDSAAATASLAVIVPFVDRVAADVTRGGAPDEAAVRHAMFAAAREQLGRVARQFGVAEPAVDLDSGSSVAGAEAVHVLDRARRVFDAARVRLWLSEAGDRSQLPAAITGFEQLRAAPYLARARQPLAANREGAGSRATR